MTMRARWRDLLGRFVDRLDQARLASGGEPADLVEKDAEVAGTTSRGSLFFKTGRAAVETGRVALLGGEVGEGAGETAGVVEARRTGLAVAHRSARVDDEAEAKIRVGFEFLDVIAVGAAPGAPVETAGVVAGNILAILRELERRATHGTAVTSRDIPDHGLPRIQLEPEQFAKHRRIEEVAL
jgi:hypothetical protein